MRLRLLAALLTLATLAVALGAGAAAAIEGPDVARYQHPDGAAIDWARVKASGRAFAIVKATEGSSYTNPWFARDWQGIRAAHLIRGSYHYARPALPISTAAVQARRYVATIGTTREAGDLPPALDLEESGGLSAGDLVTWAQTFMVTVQAQSGRTPILYSYPYFLRAALADTPALRRYPLWIAQYNGKAGPSLPLAGGWPAWTMWQYTSSGVVPGIAGRADLSRFAGTAAQLAAFANGAAAAAPPPSTPPAAPSNLAVRPAAGALDVRWVPGDNGGTLVSSFRVSVSPVGPGRALAIDVPGTTTHATVAGLSTTTAYRLTVTARNARGAGRGSAASSPVVPVVPTALAASLGPAQLTVGAAATVTVALSRPDRHAPLAGQTVTVYTRRHGTAAFARAATLVTGPGGTARYGFRPAASTDVVARFAAPPGWQAAATRPLTVLVHPALSATLSPRAIRLGQQATLTGSLSPARAGQVVYRQGFYGGAWHTWATARVSPTGRFSFTIRPTVRTTDRYRVYLPADAARAATASPTLTLAVG